MKKSTCLMLSLAAILFACNKENTENIGSISGTVSIRNETHPEIISPLAGITLYLIDADYSADSTLPADPASIIADSVVTGPDGKYLLDNIRTGRYRVSPSSKDLDYRFEPAGENEEMPVTIDAEHPSHTLDFVAPDPAPRNSQFSVIINVKNYGLSNPLAGSWNDLSYTFYRRFVNWFYWSEYHQEGSKMFYRVMPGNIEITDVDSPDNHVWNFDYGFNGPLSMTNLFRIDCFESGIFVFSVYLDLPISGCPETSTWNLDWTARTISQ